MRAEVAARVDSGGLVLLGLAAWMIPGAGHLWLGRRTKGLILLVALTAMFALGLVLDGRLFPFEASQPLVFLAAVADVAAGLPYFLAWMFHAGQGQVVAVTYEYANAFLIVAGLLNMLVVLDAFDIALGRK
jgi:heme/copper-type cytochrome/quinol oxidase subunit 4